MQEAFYRAWLSLPDDVVGPVDGDPGHTLFCRKNLQLLMPMPGHLKLVEVVMIAGYREQGCAVLDQLPALCIGRNGIADTQSHYFFLPGDFIA